MKFVNKITSFDRPHINNTKNNSKINSGFIFLKYNPESKRVEIKRALIPEGEIPLVQLVKGGDWIVANFRFSQEYGLCSRKAKKKSTSY